MPQAEPLGSLGQGQSDHQWRNIDQRIKYNGYAYWYVADRWMGSKQVCLPESCQTWKCFTFKT